MGQAAGAASCPTATRRPITWPGSCISETACAARTTAARVHRMSPEVPYWWRKVRIGAQGTDGFAEVYTGSGWRAVTRDGVQSGPGGMDYEHDMPPYVQEMADWLDDDNKPHPLRFERAFHGLEIMSALYRSAIEGGQIALPLTTGMDELDGLRGSVPDRKVLMTLADSAKEYKE